MGTEIKVYLVKICIYSKIRINQLNHYKSLIKCSKINHIKYNIFERLTKYIVMFQANSSAQSIISISYVISAKLSFKWFELIC